MFSKGEFDKKIQGIFKAFDQDGNGGIDWKEHLVFISAGISGLCKLVSLPLPRYDEILGYAYSSFKIIPHNKNDM